MMKLQSKIIYICSIVQNRVENHIQLLTGQSIYDMGWDEKKRWYAIKRIIHYLKTEALEPTEDSLHYLLSKYPDLSNYTIPTDWEEDTITLLEKLMTYMQKLGLKGTQQT